MTALLLTVPVWLMFGGAGWLMVAAARARGDSPSSIVRAKFVRMSYAVGAGFLIWCGLVLMLDIIKPAYPLVIGVIGLLLVIQGYVFARFKVL
jgi:hypothetical protein